MEKKNYLISVHRLVWQTAHEIIEARSESEALMIADELEKNDELVYSGIPDEKLEMMYVFYDCDGFPIRKFKGKIL